MPSVSVRATSSGNTQVVAAPTSGYIRVIGMQIIGKDSDISVQLRSGASSAIFRVPLPASGTGGISCPPIESRTEPYCYTAPGEALNVNLSGAGVVDVNVQFVVTGANYP